MAGCQRARPTVVPAWQPAEHTLVCSVLEHRRSSELVSAFEISVELLQYVYRSEVNNTL